MASSSISKHGSTRSTRIRRVPPLRLLIVLKISQALRTIQQCSKAADPAAHWMLQRNKAQSFGAFHAFQSPIGVTPLGTV